MCGDAYHGHDTVDLLALGLVIWSRFLARRPGAPRWVRWLWAPLIGVTVGSLLATVLGLRYAFYAASTVPAAEKAQHLADGIARAMTFTAAGLVFDLAAAVALGVYAWTGRARR
jgi:hypothetical protein